MQTFKLVKHFNDYTDDRMLDMWYNICLVQIRTTFLKDITMWTKPTATEMRFGFEVTMYVMNK